MPQSLSNARPVAAPARPAPAGLTPARAADPWPEAATLAIEVVTDPARFAVLRGEWDALWHRAAAPRLSQSFTWLETGWRICAVPRGRSLWVLLLRCEGRLVLAWPMTLRRAGGLTLAEPLGADSTEYDTLLVEQRPGAEDLIQTAWHRARALLPADCLHVAFVEDGSARAKSLETGWFARRRDSLPAPLIALAHHPRFEDYWATRAKDIRRGLDRRARRLAEIGDVRAWMLDEPAEMIRAIDTTLRSKAEWMAAKGLANHFIARADFRDFLVAMGLAGETPCGALRVMVLTCGEAVIAWKIGSIDGTRFEGFIATYDPAWEKLSPGTLLQRECLRWCHEHGLDYDLRIGDEAYKAEWATDSVTMTRLELALTRRGAAGLVWAETCERARMARDRLRARLPRRVKQVWRALAGLRRKA